MVETKRGIKWWWPWEPEKIEAYLERMRRQGWKVKAVNGTCMGFVFVRCEPADVRVCVDYQPSVAPEYRALFEDAGWSLLYGALGWYLWSKEYPEGGVRPEIYTDRESLIRRNRSMLYWMLGIFATQAAMPSLIVRMMETHGSAWIPILALYCLFFLALLYGVIRLALGLAMMKKSAGNKGGV